MGERERIIVGEKYIKDKIGTKFSLIVNMALMIVLGPLLVIPRTAATTYELGVQPLFGDINPLVIIVIYFIIICSLF